MTTTPTPRQQDALRLLAEHGPQHPRALAKLLWPDSPAWERRTRRYGTNRNGALGGTMPMNAAKMLWRLEELGLVRPPSEDFAPWTLTPAREKLAAGC